MANQAVPGVRRDIIVIGASAGGVEALCTLVRGLPADFPGTLLVVLHLAENAFTVLPRILTRAGKLPALQPADGDPLRRGKIYVAPPGRHMLVERGRVRVVDGPHENRHRPAIDPLFRTAAQTYGPRVVGVILTGSGNDGTAGLLEIKRRGGTAIVQDPEDALVPLMPQSAVEYVEVDHCRPVAEIAEVLKELVHAPSKEPSCRENNQPTSALVEGQGMPSPGKNPPTSEADLRMPEEPEMSDVASGFTCPYCRGHLWEIEDTGMLRFRCRVGHAYTAETLIADKSEKLEETLWAALNALEENAALSQRISHRARDRRSMLSADKFARRAEETRQYANQLRGLLSIPLLGSDFRLSDAALDEQDRQEHDEAHLVA